MVSGTELGHVGVKGVGKVSEASSSSVLAMAVITDIIGSLC